MKAKYDVYIQIDLQERFNKEPNKSGLVNDLLAAYYESNEKPKPPTPTPRPEPIAKNDAVVKECKAGHLLNDWGKCTWKGCKYS